MKFPLLVALSVLISSFAFGEEITPATSAASELKLKIRFAEKTVKGKRIVTVFVKNEGFKDVAADAEILLAGASEKEKQSQQVKLNIPLRREASFDINVLESFPFRAMTDPEKVVLPVTKISNVSVVIGENSFKAL